MSQPQRDDLTTNRQGPEFISTNKHYNWFAPRNTNGSRPVPKRTIWCDGHLPRSIYIYVAAMKAVPLPPILSIRVRSSQRGQLKLVFPVSSQIGRLLRPQTPQFLSLVALVTHLHTRDPAPHTNRVAGSARHAIRSARRVCFRAGLRCSPSPRLQTDALSHWVSYASIYTAGRPPAGITALRVTSQKFESNAVFREVKFEL